MNFHNRNNECDFDMIEADLFKKFCGIDLGNPNLFR